MKNPKLHTVLLVPAAILLIPLIAMRFTSEVNWTASDFIIMYVLMTGVGLLYKLFAAKADSGWYCAAAGLTLGASFLLIWVNLAVGFIGSEDNPANILYLGVLVIGAAGAALARFEPDGMAKAVFTMSAAQFLVPIVAYLAWRPNFDAGVVKIFFLNTVWVLMYFVAGTWFRHAAQSQRLTPSV